MKTYRVTAGSITFLFQAVSILAAARAARIWPRVRIERLR
jgi:hypothetical protein